MGTQRQRRAFTLIEVLVVVAIIALLISILLPSLEAARRESRKVACLANLDQLGSAATAYLVDHKGRFCWGELYYSSPNAPPIPRFRTWYFGGNRATGKGLSWWSPGAWYDYPTNKRPLNRYIAGSMRNDKSDLRVYECPTDKGLAISTDPLEKPTAETAYRVIGTSYQSNSVWRYYAADPRSAGWGEGWPTAGEQDARVVRLMDSIVRIFEKKSASRAIMLYEDRADISMAGATDIPADLKIQGWHGQANRHSMLFLDGHAANLYVQFKKVMDYSYQGGSISYLCNPVTSFCRQGTSDWVARPDYREE